MCGCSVHENTRSLFYKQHDQIETLVLLSCCLSTGLGQFALCAKSSFYHHAIFTLWPFIVFKNKNRKIMTPHFLSRGCYFKSIFKFTAILVTFCPITWILHIKYPTNYIYIWNLLIDTVILSYKTLKWPNLEGLKIWKVQILLKDEPFEIVEKMFWGQNNE